MTRSVPADSAVPVRVRFKYLLGEWVLGEWRPTFLPRRRAAFESLNGWPSLEQLPVALLPAEAAGYQVRRTAVDRFPRGISRQGEWLCYSPRQESLYFVSLVGSFDAYLQLRSAKSRQNLRRSVKRFVDRNPDCLEVFTQPHSMAEFHSAAVAISKKTYQTFMLHAGLPDTPEYLRTMQETALRGEARGYLLRDQGQPVAFAWCTERNDEVTYQIIGYLPEHADKSPGTVLLYLIVQDLFAQAKYRLFDFGPGSASYKEAFATDKIEFADAYLFRPGIGNVLKVWMLWWGERFSSAAGSVLDRLGLKKNIRVLMRKIKAYKH